MVFIKRHVFILLSFLSVNIFASENETKEADIPPLPPMELEAQPKNENTEVDSQPVVMNQKSTNNFSSFLNALELAGYFRMRFHYFHNAHLGTYIPDLNRGTSNMLPNLNLRNLDASARTSSEKNVINPSQSNFSANMRLRLDPTINVSEVISIKSSLDIFDNLVLGSTPYYSSIHQVSATARSQSAPKENAIKLNRLWAEANFPIAELKFGRLPMHFGLGILYNSGNNMDDDYGDQVDGIFVSTKIMDHYVSLGYSVAYAGPINKGLGLFTSEDPWKFLPNYGQKYPLEASDLAHVFSLSILKKESEFALDKKMAASIPIFQYGLFLSYRSQSLDTYDYSGRGDDAQKTYIDLANQTVKRNANIALSSLWMAFDLSTFHIETEIAGVFGRYYVGSNNFDLLARDATGTPTARNIWLLNGGFAVESKYGFFDDRLQLGLDGGWASGDDRKYGIYINGDQKPLKSKYSTNFKFNQAYTVDRLMYRQVLGTVSGSFYFKPHIAYFFSPNLGLRGDVISSLADYAESTPGNSRWLGVETDLSAFLRTESGFYFSANYAILFPLAGLNHQEGGDISSQNYKNFGKASIAQTLQFFLGFSF